MTVDEIEALLEGADDEWLFSEADRLRRREYGVEVFLRGVVEFSSFCANSCLYCGLRSPNRMVWRYRLGRSEILGAARLAGRLGMGTVVLQSGDDFHYTGRFIGEVIQAVKNRHDIAVTLSLGDRSLDEFARWKECGADRYLLKIETFNREIYEKMRPNCRVHDRLRRIEELKALGYEVGSGLITNLPGMTRGVMAQDIARLAELDLDMIAVGPFVPHPDTPLGWAPAGDPQTALRACALLRVMNPHANIPATSALSALEEGARQRALFVGANVLMPSVTPEGARERYTIYPGKNTDPAMLIERIAQSKRMIRDAGFEPSSSKGFSSRRKYGQSSSGSEIGDHHPRTQECGQIVPDQRRNR